MTYAERLARGLCGRCGAREHRPRRKTCGQCAKASYASNRAWIAKNAEKCRSYYQSHNKKRRSNRARCLSCPAPVKRFRRCLDCRKKQIRSRRRKRRRQGNPSANWITRRRRLNPLDALQLRRQGLTYAAIASRLGCSLPCAWKMVKRALKLPLDSHPGAR